MSKQKKIAKITILIIILFAILAYFFFPITPLSSLNTTDIKEIHVLVIPPEQTVILRQEEIEQAVELLQEIKVYQPSFTSDTPVGQFIKFTIIKTDGTKIEMSNAGNLIISVNGIYYRAEYSSVEALSSFVSDVLE